MAYLLFYQARAYLHAEGLQSEADWYHWRETQKRPSDIPPYPEIFYQNKGWKNLYDWLGLKKNRTQEILTVSHALLKASESFSSLSTPLFQQLLTGATTKTFPQGSIIFSPHQSMDSLCVLLRGSLDFFINQSLVMSYSQLGDLWGEAEYLLKMENLFRIETSSPTQLLSIPFEGFQESSLLEIKGWMSSLLAKKYFHIILQKAS